MCGVIGKLTFSKDVKLNSLENGLNLMINRGPDNQTIVEEGSLSMGHARLSIIDVTDHSNQPVRLDSGKSIFSFNGEIYNFKELADKHLGVKDAKSDTLVLKDLLEKFSLIELANLVEGMFVIVVYNIKSNSLEIIRDRIGEKPLYYTADEDYIAYASNLDSLCSIIPETRLDKKSFRRFFKYGYFDDENTPYLGVKKLSPGCYLKCDKNGLIKKQYWTLPKRDVNGKASVALLHDKLVSVVKKEIISDVTIGSFLSGGIDSTLISAIMSKVSQTRVKTFSIGFQNKNFDESGYARAVADYLGTEHYEKRVTENDLYDAIPQFQKAYDEPFADSSAIPTLILAKMAKEYVTVALSGDGADELFGGYRRYFETVKYWKYLQRIPLSLRKSFSKGMESFAPNEMSLKYSKGLKAADMNGLYSLFTIYWDIGLNEEKLIHSVDDMMSQDIKTYLVDDIMVKVDRATMHSSLESRAPFLHHHIVEYAQKFSQDQLIHGTKGKLPLRRILKEYIPSNLIDRPKMGFGVPLRDWLTGPLSIELKRAVDNIELSLPEIAEELSLRKEVESLLSRGVEMHKLWLVFSLGLWLDERKSKTVQH